MLSNLEKGKSASCGVRVSVQVIMVMRAGPNRCWTVFQDVLRLVYCVPRACFVLGVYIVLKPALFVQPGVAFISLG